MTNVFYNSGVKTIRLSSSYDATHILLSEKAASPVQRRLPRCSENIMSTTVFDEEEEKFGKVQTRMSWSSEQVTKTFEMGSRRSPVRQREWAVISMDSSHMLERNMRMCPEE